MTGSRSARYVAPLVLLAALVSACGDEAADGTADDGGPDETAESSTKPTAARHQDLPDAGKTPEQGDFVSTIDNPYLPWLPGSRWVYRVSSPEGAERIIVRVTDRSKVVQGVTTVVVRDTVTQGGELIEDTYDWYAQDVDGNVWYFGEDTVEYDGKETSTAGSWEAGVDGAEAGIVMLANPRPGDAYRQEYYEGEAEDEGKVLATDERVSVPYGHYTDVVKTADFTPLEPNVLEHKYYARGVGVVLEVGVKGGQSRTELVAFNGPE